MPKVLISDKMNPQAAAIFRANGITVDEKTDLSPDELLAVIGEYDGLAIRSSTTVTADVIAAAKKMKVMGRAGIGVDNIDVPAATAAGIVVMNTPFGNSITTAEHAIAMMFAVARDIPQASASTHAGKWEKSKFMGVELYAKTLGVVGCGNIGAIVASRAQGLQMKVIGYDPFLTDERAAAMGIEKVDLDTLYERADFITLHVPKTENTTHMINAQTIAKMKKGVRIINCARGGIIDEAALKDALDSGYVAGAALDVFEQEPAKENILFGHPNLVCTPHLGASTDEAQVNVAIQVAEQMSAFLLQGAVANALNMPSISAEDAPRLRPYIALAEQIGAFAGQIVESAIKEIHIEYCGDAADLNVKPLSAALLAHVLRPLMDSVNMVNAPQIAKSRGIAVTESHCADSGDLHSAVRLRLVTEKAQRSVTGTLFGGKAPRIVEIEGVPIEAALAAHMLFIRNDDKPGMIGGVGTILAQAGQNIADFRLGRHEAGGTAVALVALDAALPDEVLEKIRGLAQVQVAKRLSFAA